MLSFFFLATLLAGTTAHATRLDYPVINNQINLLRPKSGSGGRPIEGVSCLSWRLGVETNNIIDWKTVPEQCEGYVGHYMLGGQYRKDSKVVANEACRYAENLTLSNDSKDVWILDVDETSLSNLPFFAIYGFGAEPINRTLFTEWMKEARAPALPESLKLYKHLLYLGFRIVILTGRHESGRSETEANLANAGYDKWAKLLLRGAEYKKKITTGEYKAAERKKLVEAGYRIVGNVGDQWSDILGAYVGDRTFKLPNPMYYDSLRRPVTKILLGS